MCYYTLLIWEENPDTIKLFLLPEEESKKHREYLDEAHDRMINSDYMNDGMRFLNTALSKEECIDSGFEQYRGIWVQYQVKDTASPILDTNITKVYKSGYIL